jgi:hypothetical protein
MNYFENITRIAHLVDEATLDIPGKDGSLGDPDNLLDPGAGDRGVPGNCIGAVPGH